jgi:acyl-CoA dehydrogenase
MCVTEPDNPPYQRMSVLIVPGDTPGLVPLREVQVGSEEHRGIHTYLRYENVRVPKENLLGQRGQAFVVMQTRMGHARLALASRALGQMRRAYDLLCERTISRETQGEKLSRKQLVQEHVAEAWLSYQQFRLLVMQTAWKLDNAHNDFKAVRADLAAVKIALPRALHDIAYRAAQVHGSRGVSRELPFTDMMTRAVTAGVADGPTEVHKVTLARQELSRYTPHPGLFPNYHIPTLRDQARARYADVLARHGRS